MNIEDDTTGVEQCNACNNTHTVTVDEATGTTYCGVGCIKGVTYESLNDGCIPCRKADGTPNDTAYQIPLTEKAHGLCEACNRVAFSKKNGDNVSWYCSKVINEGYFADSTGDLKNCASAPNTMIPNTSKAISVCESASCNRMVETDRDGQVWCMKN